MGNFQLPKTTVFDINGNPVSGAKLKFYVTGTSTPAAVYSDEALGVSLGTTVTADSAGRVAAIYLDTAVTYKLTVTDANDVTIYTVDPVKAYALSGASISTRLRQVAITPLDYSSSIVGDGAANEVTAVQWAIDNAAATVDLVGKTFRCDSAITLRSGIRLINGTLDFSNATAAELVKIIGTHGSYVNLSSDVEIGATSITVSSTSGWAAGDWLRLFSTFAWYSGIDDGELVQIKSVDSGTVVTLTSKTFGRYPSGSQQVAKLTMLNNVVMQDVTVVCAYTGGTQKAVFVQYNQNLALQNVKVRGAYTIGIAVENTVNSSLDRCDVRNQTQAAGRAYGLSNGCRNVTVSNCRAENAVIGIEVGGNTSGSGDVAVCRNVLIEGCTTIGTTSTGISVESQAQYTTIHGNSVACGTGASSDGIANYGIDTTIRGNTIRHPTRYGVLIQPKRSRAYTTAVGGTPASKSDETSAFCTDNLIEFPGSDGVRVLTDSSSQALSGVNVSRNDINGAGAYGVYVGVVDFNVSNLRIDGNTLSACGEAPISVNVTAAKVLSRANICNNIAEGHGSTKDGIQLIGGDASCIVGAVVSGNDLKGGADGIYVKNATKTVVNGNVVNDPAAHGVSVEYTVTGTMRNLIVSSNVIEDPGSDGINCDVTAGATLSDFQLCQNTITTPVGEAVYVNLVTAATLRRLRVSDNTAVAATATEEAILIAAADAAGVTGVSISNNTLTGWARGADLTKCAQAVVTDNTITLDATNGTRGIQASGCTGFVAANNAIDGGSATSAIGVYAADASYMKVIGNILRQCDTGAVKLENTGATNYKEWRISGNTCVDGGTGTLNVVASSTGDIDVVHISDNSVELATSGVGLFVIPNNASAAISNVHINGNRIRASSCMQLGGSGTLTEVFVSGNKLVATSDPVIEFVSNVAGGAILGNHMVDGDYAVDATGYTLSNFAIAGNYMHSQSEAAKFAGTIAFDAISTTEADLPNLYS